MTVDSLQELEENFELFDSWEDKYSYLIDLGKRLPAFEDDLKIAEREVKGCVSKVWMESWISAGENGAEIFHFKADSDAMIVKGLIAILMVAFNDRPNIIVQWGSDLPEHIKKPKIASFIPVYQE